MSDDVIFNLFIMQFFGDVYEIYNWREYDYEVVKNHHVFKTLKECFPENEYCSALYRANYIKEPTLPCEVKQGFKCKLN